MRALALLFSMALLAAPALAASGPVSISDPGDRQIVQEFLRHVDAAPGRLTAEICKRQAAESPEGYTWQLCPYLGMFLTAYDLTGESKYLDMFAQSFDNMRSALTRGPDGFLGWYGKALSTFQDPDNPDRKVDVIITSFRITDQVSEFLEKAAGDPAWRQRYPAVRAQYLDLLENHLVKKWDARGNYVDLGERGAIYRTHFGLAPVKGNLTEPHNKHSICIRGLLGLYRVTGKPEYAAKAVKLGTRYKHSLTLKDGHYEWNYWDPAGAWDVHPDEPGRWKHWIGVEHKSGYYCSSLTQAVVLYQHGLVFDETDMQRFVKTQTEMCWNGDMQNPEWARVDGTTSDRYMQGAYICGALAPLSPKVAQFLYEGARRQERLDNAGHPWQGGPVAAGWVEGKFITLPRAKGGAKPHVRAGQQFLSDPQRRDWYGKLAFQVTEPGYSAPQSPRQMDPMPTAPE